MNCFLKFYYEENGQVGKISNTYLIDRNKFIVKTFIEKEMNQRKEAICTIKLSDSDLAFIYNNIFLFLEKNKNPMLDEYYYYSVGNLNIDNKNYIYYDDEKFFNMVFSISEHLKETHPECRRGFLNRYNESTQTIYKKKMKFDKKKK